MSKKILFISILIFSLFLDVKSQEVAASEVYYEQLSSKKYLVTANVYRKCETAPLTKLDGIVVTSSLRVAMNFQRIAIKRINDTCNNPCQLSNQASNAGFEKHTFIDTVDFNTAPYDTFVKRGMCTIKFAILQQLRSSSISNINIGNGMLFLDASVNICLNLPSNHSPKFSFDPKFNAAMNENLVYSPAPIDTFEFDSLSFEMDIPYKDNGIISPYINGFSKDYPMTPYCPPTPGKLDCKPIPNAKPPRGFYFDSELCQIHLTPVANNENAIVKFKTKEFRKDSSGNFQLIGYVCREMIIHVEPISNNGLSIIESSNNKYAFCNGDKFCFQRTVKDYINLPKQLIADTVYLDWNQGIPSGDFQITNPNDREKTFEFCWQPTISSENKDLYFGVQHYDKLCNINTTYNNYKIRVLKNVDYSKSYTLNNCNQVNFEVTNNDNLSSIIGEVSILNSSGKTLFLSNQLKDSFTINENGEFYIKYAIRNTPYNCQIIRYDTLQIQNAVLKGFNYTPKDTAVCVTAPISLRFNPANHPNVTQWIWYQNDSIISTTDSIIQMNFEKTSRFKLVLIDNNQCTSISERTFNPYFLQTNLFNFDNLTTCDSQLYIFTPNSTGLKQPISIQWKIQDVDYSTSDSISIYPKDNEKMAVYLIDGNHCHVSDSVYFKKDPGFSFDFAQDHSTFCKDSILKLSLTNMNTPLPVKVKWLVDGQELISERDSLNITKTISKSNQINVTVTNKNNCIEDKSIVISNKALAKLNSLSNIPACPSENILFESNAKTVDPSRIVKWYVDDVKQINQTDKISISNSSDFKLRLTLEYDGVCETSDSMDVQLLPKSSFNILSDTIFNHKHFVKMSLDRSFSDYLWTGGNVSQNNDFWAYDLGAPGRYKIECQVIDSNNCKSTEFIYIHTDGFTGIDNAETTANKVYPNPFQEYLKLEIETAGEFEIWNLNGQLIQKQTLSVGTHEIDTRELIAGIYFIKIGNHKFVIVKQ